MTVSIRSLTAHRYKAFFGPIAIGYLIFFVLLVFSILFYPERTCYSDIAFQTYLIINTENVAFQLDRYGAAIIQFFPFLFSVIGLPLKYILISYSVSLVLENLFFYWLLHKVLKQNHVALILVLYNILMVTDSFYWATNELKQGFSFCILFAGVAMAMPVENFSGLRKGGVALLYLTLLTTAIFLHPVTIFAVVFIVGYLTLRSEKIFSQTLLWNVLLVAAILAVKYLVLPIPSYDTDKYELKDNFTRYFPNYFSLPSFSAFISQCIKDWYLYALMVFAVVAFYIWQRQWLKMAWLLVFSFGFLLIVNVSYIRIPKAFIECYYLGLSIFILFPFVIECLPKLKTKHIAMLLLVFAVLRLNTIYHAHNAFTKRLNIVRHTLASYPGKFIFPQNQFPMNWEMNTWGVSYETIILTSLQSPDSCRSFAVLGNTDKIVLGNDKTIFHHEFGSKNYDYLNPKYFRPAPGEYRMLTKEEIENIQQRAGGSGRDLQSRPLPFWDL